MTATRIRSAPVVDYSWQSRAACRDTAPGLFLGPDDEHLRDRVRRETLAVRVCVRCPVRRDCLDHARRIPERHGVWGATTPEERAAMDLLDTADLELLDPVLSPAAVHHRSPEAGPLGAGGI